MVFHEQCSHHQLQTRWSYLAAGGSVTDSLELLSTPPPLSSQVAMPATPHAAAAMVLGC